ncbi:MAG TPA: hypothetical protein VFP94_05935 [Terriglobales bacterium]|nr:hypothetical protein [Terriglobales bacterium]
MPQTLPPPANFASPQRERGRGPDSRGFALLAWAAGGLTCLWALLQHRLLLYGDATAHLAIARRMVDSATPGLAQWGTVWLPLPHLLMAPLVWFLPLWRNGLAGAAPSWLALGVATWLLHRLVRRSWGAGAAAWAAAVFCLNPSLLYLSAVPMTESIYLACFLGVVDQCSAYAHQPRLRHAWAAGGWGLAASLCRYDGWFLLPLALAALALSSPNSIRALRAGWRFCLVAGLGPAFWLAYNGWYFNDPLGFARGPYSARGIYEASLRAGGFRYPGDHALGLAVLYYLKTVVVTCGTPLMILALLGVLGWRHWRRRPAAWLLLAPLPWYVWAMWSGNVPIFLPQYWPHGYYNLRYGVQLLPAVALFSGLTVAALWRGAGRVIVPGWSGARLAAAVGIGLALVCSGSYLWMLRAPGPPAYAEAVHNAPARLEMEHLLAAALLPRQAGEQVLMYYGNFPGALADDGIPLHEVVQESNFLLWQDALLHPQAAVEWVVRESDSPTWRLVNQRDLRQYFEQVADLHVATQHEIKVYRRREH